ncbi:MAG: MlaD family protein, partial [Armatimonadota bacterium]|nr:MlaD family protein [Armatimonadota bacterium]
MKSRVAFSVGLLVLVVAVAGYALMGYVKEGIGEGQGYRVHARFRDAQGLFGKSRVQTAGIEIGKILSKELAERRPDDKEPKAKVVVVIDRRVVLYEDATVSRRAASLLGEYYLEVDPGTPAGADGRAHRRLEEGDEIVNVLEAIGTSDVIEQVGQTVPVLRE